MLSLDQTSFHLSSSSSSSSGAAAYFPAASCFRCYAHGVSCGGVGGVFGVGADSKDGVNQGDPLELSPFSAYNNLDTPVLLAYNPFYSASGMSPNHTLNNNNNSLANYHHHYYGNNVNNNVNNNPFLSPNWSSSTSPRMTPPLSRQMLIFEIIDGCGGGNRNAGVYATNNQANNANNGGDPDEALASLKNLVEEDPLCLRWRDWSGRSPLGYAAFVGNEKVVEFFLSFLRVRGGDTAITDELNFRLRKGKTALALACEGGALSVVRTMVEAGADLFAADAANWTPLDVAAFHCHLDIVEYLLNNGSEVHDTTDPNSRTILHLLAEIKNMSLHQKVADVANAILKHCSGSIVNFQDGQQRTALHEANESNNGFLVETLLRFGAGVNIRDCRRNTPIFDAIGQGHAQCVKQMLKAKDINLSARNFYSYTPMHIAIVAGSLSCTRLLLSCGADVRLRAKRQRTCAHLAARDAHYHILDYLLASSAAARNNVNGVKEDDAATPLMTALRNYDVIMSEDPRVGAERLGATIAVLLRHGADANRRDAFGETPATLAATKRLWSLVRLLVLAGGEVDKATLKRQLQPMFVVVTKRKDIGGAGSGGVDGNVGGSAGGVTSDRGNDHGDEAPVPSSTDAANPPVTKRNASPNTSPLHTRYIARIETFAPSSPPKNDPSNDDDDDVDDDVENVHREKGEDIVQVESRPIFSFSSISSSSSSSSRTSSSSTTTTPIPSPPSQQQQQQQQPQQQPQPTTSLSISIPPPDLASVHHHGLAHPRAGLTESTLDKQWCVDFLFHHPLQLVDLCRRAIRRSMADRLDRLNEYEGEAAGAGASATRNRSSIRASATSSATSATNGTTTGTTPATSTLFNATEAPPRLRLPTPLLRFLRLEELLDPVLHRMIPGPEEEEEEEVEEDGMEQEDREEDDKEENEGRP